LVGGIALLPSLAGSAGANRRKSTSSGATRISVRSRGKWLTDPDQTPALGDRTPAARQLYERDADRRSEGFVMVEFSNVLATYVHVTQRVVPALIAVTAVTFRRAIDEASIEINGAGHVIGSGRLCRGSGAWLLLRSARGCCCASAGGCGAAIWLVPLLNGQSNGHGVDLGSVMVGDSEADRRGCGRSLTKRLHVCRTELICFAPPAC